MSVATPSVVQLLTRMNVGGPAVHVLSLARHLRSDFQVVVAAGTPDAVESEHTSPDVPTVRVSLQRRPSPVHDARGVRDVRALLARTQPAILHTHMAKAGTIGRIAASTAPTRPRLVHTFHGHVLDGYFSAPVRRAFLAVERFLAARTDVLVAVSEAVRDELLDLGVGREGQYRVVRPGIAVDAYRSTPAVGYLRRRIGVDDDVPVVGVIGRLAPVKGLDVLLRAHAGLPGVHLAVVGDGPSRGELEDVAHALGIADRTHFLGWCQRIPDVLADLDVVVSSSRHEGTPLALMEASASGRPVVATRVGGVPDVVEHGVTGLLVDPGDPEGLRAAVRSLLESPERRRALGAAGSAAASRFDEAVCASRTASVYQELLG